jgi:hypothetical protein
MKKSFGKRVKEFFVGNNPSTVEQAQRPKVEVPGFAKPVSLPAGTRYSIPHQPLAPNIILGSLGGQYRIVNHQFIVQVIPLIRKLMMINPDVGQAIHNIVSLGNTGHKIIFDSTVPLDQVDLMRRHLENKKLDWAAGTAGMDGLVNKMFSQVLVGGALSNEWVPNRKLNGLETVILVNPEDIVYTLEENNTKYVPWQRIIGGGGFIGAQPLLRINPSGLIPLSPYTYRYYALNGDSEVPYGFPPYMAAMERIRTQNNMNMNIDFVVDQFGLLGFLELLIQKPMKMDSEDEGNYNTRLDNILTLAKQRVEEGMSSGVVAGFKDDHEFKFNGASRTLDKALELFKNNELQIGSALKQDMTLFGRDYNTSETQITVVFMKMLSELKNIQNLVKTNLEFGYALELTLAGFKFDFLKVQFNRSTLMDDLKYQQAQELKIRNVMQKMIMGIINQDQAADELDYEKPAYPEPMVPWEILAGGSTPTDQAADDTKREKGKDKSDKKVRDKNKPISKDK